MCGLVGIVGGGSNQVKEWLPPFNIGPDDFGHMLITMKKFGIYDKIVTIDLKMDLQPFSNTNKKVVFVTGKSIISES